MRKRNQMKKGIAALLFERIGIWNDGGSYSGVRGQHAICTGGNR